MWSSASRTRVAAGRRCISTGTSRRTSVPPAGTREIARRPPISIARSRIPPRPPTSCSAPCGRSPRPSSRTRSTTLPFARGERQRDAVASAWRATLVSALLRRRGRSRGPARAPAPAGRRPSSWRTRSPVRSAKPAASVDQRAAQPELVERLRPQPARDVAHLLHRARARASCDLLGRRLQLGAAPSRASPSSCSTMPVSVWPSSSCSSRARRRRSRSCAASARRPLVRRSCSSAVEHLVEGVAAARRPRPPAARRRSGARAARVDAPHQRA